MAIIADCLAAGNKVRRISQISADVVRRYHNREITLRATADLRHVPNVLLAEMQKINLSQWQTYRH